MKFGIVGCGLMGHQRARGIGLLSPRAEVAAVFDPDETRARELASKLGCLAAQSLQDLLAQSGIEVVIVAVPHWLARDTTVAALRAGKHVLCEKPLGLTVHEAEEAAQAAIRYGRILTPGFNYRFYPGYLAAARAVKTGSIGDLTHIRAQLGHGGRPGYEKEWKTKKALCGGGALLDPGIHFIDLIRFYAGEIRGGSAVLSRTFWDIDVEDNAFVQLETESGIPIQMHISITEWRSRAAMDLFGRDGGIQVRGRSGFYGAQTMRIKRRWDWIEPATPEQFVEYAAEDLSFAAELQAMVDLLEGRSAPELATAGDGVRALQIVEDLYRRFPLEGVPRTWKELESIS